MWWEAQVTEIVPVANVQGILPTGYFAYTASCAYLQEAASLLFLQNCTLEETKLSDGLAISKETRWSVSTLDLDVGTGSNARVAAPYNLGLHGTCPVYKDLKPFSQTNCDSCNHVYR